MSKFLKSSVLFVAAFLFHDAFAMDGALIEKNFPGYLEKFDLSEADLEAIENHPDVVKLKEEQDFIESEIERIDSKLKRREYKGTKKKKGKACQKEGTKTIKVPVVNALNAFLPCQNRFSNPFNRLHKKKLDKMAKYMNKKFDIYGTNATNGFEYNSEKKQSISHWIFRDGLDEYYNRSNSTMSEDSKKLAVFRSLRALRIWGADLSQTDPDTTDYRGNTPVHYAAKSFNCDAVKFLCKAGVEVNIRNNKGTTPLLGLVQQRQKIVGSVERCIAALAQSGADINLANKKGISVASIIADIKMQKSLPSGSFSTLSPFSYSPTIDSATTCRLEKIIKRNLPYVTAAG